MMMSSFVIRGIDESVAKRLKAEALRRGVSVNALVKAMLRESLGLSKPPYVRRHTDLDHLAGTWTAAESRAFLKAIAPLERVDAELWH